jgi:hypothetical protein
MRNAWLEEWLHDQKTTVTRLVRLGTARRHLRGMVRAVFTVRRSVDAVAVSLCHLLVPMASAAIREDTVKLERYMAWCEEHENLIMLATGVVTLILGPVFYCVALNHGEYFDWIFKPFALMDHVLNWFCGC